MELEVVIRIWPYIKFKSPVSERKSRLLDTGLLIIERHLVGCLPIRQYLMKAKKRLELTVNT
jgi:hypothetical protein